MMDPYDIRIELSGRVDLIIDGGYCGNVVTSMIDLTTGTPEVLREGLGDISDFV